MRRRVFNAVAWYVRHTPPHPGRGVLARTAYRWDPHDVVHEMAPGVRLLIRIDRDEELVYWRNGYDQNADVQVFESLLRPGMVAIDIGANIGMYALFASRAVGPAGRVLAFEPVPDLYGRLTANLGLSGALNVSPYQLAMSDRDGTAAFHIGTSESMGSLVRSQSAGTIEVRTATLDGFLDGHDVHRVHVVKIDAEGAEARIVSGMRGLLARPDRPVLFVEHNYDALRAAGSSAEELFATLVGCGYQAHLVERGTMRAVDTLGEPFRAGGETYANYVFVPR